LVHGYVVLEYFNASFELLHHRSLHWITKENYKFKASKEKVIFAIDSSFGSVNIDLFYSEIEILKKSRYIFGCLCKANIELNKIFSSSTLVAVSSKLITTVYGLFAIIYQLRQQSSIMDKTAFLNYIVVVGDLLVVLIYFTAADMPIRQVT